MRIKRIKYIILKWRLLLLIISVLPSCKKFIDIELSKNLIDANLIFKDDATAISAVTAIYHDLARSPSFTSSNRRLTVQTGFAADELFEIAPTSVGSAFENNMITPQTSSIVNIWSAYYKAIYEANAILEGLNRSAVISESVKKQIEGEALFMRAFSHFYLLNIYGDIPLILTTDYQQNSLVKRSSASKVYNQIVIDLIKAQACLSENYVSVERVRPNRATATALLSRVYLYMDDWANAEEQSSSLIDNINYGLDSNLDNVFLTSSQEAIWQFGATVPDFNTAEGSNFIMVNSVKNIALREEFVFSFEDGDERRNKWIGSFSNTSGLWYFPYKYKVSSQAAPISEYLTVFRLAEQYLINAEAKIQNEDIVGGIGVLNLLRSMRRALPSLETPNPLPDLLSSLTKEEALLAVENERKHELFTEWGHRWFDLKRTGRSTAVLGPIKGDNWQSTDELFPIPQEEMNKNPDLKPQNPGYN